MQIRSCWKSHTRLRHGMWAKVQSIPADGGKASGSAEASIFRSARWDSRFESLETGLSARAVRRTVQKAGR